VLDRLDLKTAMAAGAICIPSKHRPKKPASSVTAAIFAAAEPLRWHMLILRLLAFTLFSFAVAAAPNNDPFPKAPDIKGLQVQMNEDAIALGIHHAAINVNLTQLLDPSRKRGNPVRSAAGHEFSLNEGYLRSLDRQVRPLSDKGIVVYLILLAYP
jgi:hypothetical protein